MADVVDFFEEVSPMQLSSFTEAISPDLYEAAYRAYTQRQTPDIENLVASYALFRKEIELGVNRHFFDEGEDGNYIAMFIKYMAKEIKGKPKLKKLLTLILNNKQGFINYLLQAGKQIIAELYHTHLPNYSVEQLMQMMDAEQ